MKLIDAIINNSKESRKEYLLHTFANEEKKVALILNTSFGSMKIPSEWLSRAGIRCYWTVQKMYNQRLNYLHWNPITAGFVAEPWHWVYSNSTDYFIEKKGLLDIIILNGF